MYSRPRTPYVNNISSLTSIYSSQSTSQYPCDQRRGGTAHSHHDKDNHPKQKAYYCAASPDIRGPSPINQNWSQRPTKPGPMKVFGQLEHIQEEKPSKFRPPTRRRSPSGMQELGELADPSKRPQTTQNTRSHEIPIIVSREEGKKRRILSAHKGPSKGKLTAPKNPPFESTLDAEFINLFD